MSIPLTDTFSSRDVPGYVDIFGLSFATNTVTVNGQIAYRKGEYFRKELPVTNGSVALWTNITVAATGQSSVSGNVFVPQTPETFGYDADGNMTNDGRWTFTWDAENRLVQVESLSSGPTPSKRKVAWEYDSKGRRMRQTTSDKSSGSYVVTEDLKLLSDGWRNIAELNATNNALIRSYTWGLDLSGSMDGAGGVGGLLMMNSAANGAHFSAYDGNGNVAALVKASDGSVSANYEYDPFGQTIRATGLMAKENPFRFSTKRSDNATDFLLYEYRFYNSSLGRWLNRDPIEEAGGVNLFGFVRNNPANNIDLLGLSDDNRPPDIADSGGGAIYGSPGRYSPEQCAALLADILRLTALLAAEIAKYDPVTDGQGGWPTTGGGVTGPGGHYNKIQELIAGIQNRINKYLKECRACGPRGPAIPQEVYDTVKQKVPKPVPPAPSPIIIPAPPLPTPFPGRRPNPFPFPPFPFPFPVPPGPIPIPVPVVP